MTIAPSQLRIGVKFLAALSSLLRRVRRNSGTTGLDHHNCDVPLLRCTQRSSVEPWELKVRELIDPTSYHPKLLNPLDRIIRHLRQSGLDLAGRAFKDSGLWFHDSNRF